MPKSMNWNLPRDSFLETADGLRIWFSRVESVRIEAPDGSDLQIDNLRDSRGRGWKLTRGAKSGNNART